MSDCSSSARAGSHSGPDRWRTTGMPPRARVAAARPTARAPASPLVPARTRR
jgi:hypothetical protein